MTTVELITPLEARDGNTDRFARELADDLQGDLVEVVWLMVDDEIYLARRTGDE